MNYTEVSSETNLTNCDKEKIHLISYVQGHGAFVAISILDLRIHHASENVGTFFGTSEGVHFFVGGKLGDLIGPTLAKLLQDKIRSTDLGPDKHLRLHHQLESGQNYDIFIYQVKSGLFGIEFEKSDDTEGVSVPAEEILNPFVDRMLAAQDLYQISRDAARAVRQLTGMERVMIYRFFPPSMYGEVIAEDKSAEAHSFMSHRFPATDIPKPARDLYLKNHVRFIYDSRQVDSEIYPKGKLTGPLDMSNSRLRGVSKIHLEYLKNMGVASSLSFAIIIDGELWGLIACHNSKPIYVSHKKRALCETISKALSMGASKMSRIHEQDRELVFYNELYELLDKVKSTQDPQDYLFREGNHLLSLFDCSGFVLATKDKIDMFGVTPLPEDIKKIWGLVTVTMDSNNTDTFHTDSLSVVRPEFNSFKEQASGILAIRLGEMSDRVFIFMRPEFLEVIRWGGDPRKNFEERNYNGIINPRESFETWSETTQGISKPWTKLQVNAIRAFKNIFFDILIQKENLIQELHKELRKKN